MSLSRIEGSARVSGAIIIVAAGIVCISAGCGPSRHDMEEQAAETSALAERDFNSRNFSQALAATREAMQLNGELRNDSALAGNYLLLANCQRQLGEYDSALVSFQNAVQYFHSLNDQQLERRARIGLADFYSSMSNAGDALAIAADAASAAKIFSDVGDAYRALMIVARSSHALERYDDEAASLIELARIDSQAHHGRDRALLLRSMMQAYEGSGNREKSAEVFERWKNLAVSTGDSAELGRSYYYWGLNHESLEHPDSALRAYSRALGYAGKGHDLALQVEILDKLGNLTYRSRRFADAHRYFADALDLSRRTNSIVMKEMLSLALIACDAGGAGDGADPSTAELVARCAEVGDVCRKSGFHPGEALADFMSGRLTELGGGLAASLVYYRRALDTYEQHMPLLRSELLRFIDSYMEVEKTGWHEALIRVYCASGRADSALGVIERKNLLDAAGFFSRLKFKASDPKLTQKISAVQWNLSALRLLEKDLVDELAEGVPESSGRLQSLTSVYPRRLQMIDASVNDLAGANPNFPWLLKPGRLDLASIRGNLAPRSALVEFAPSGSALYLLVVSGDGIALRSVSVGRQSLLSLVRDYNRLAGETRLTGNGVWIGDPAAQSRLNGLSSALFKIIIAPIMGDLTGIEKLYLVPPGEFGWLPLHTLRGEGRPLVDRMNISYLPTAAVLFFSSQPGKAVKRIVGIGHPGKTAWDVEYELKDIRSFFTNPTMLFDTMATLSHLMDSVYDVVHIAAEFRFDSNVPNNSVLMLADGITPFGVRRVPLGELIAIPPPQAVVFSNLSPRPGGLTHYGPLVFLANGTRTVIASVWQADRKAKKFFGEGFYTGLLAELPASDAYQRAVEGMIRQPEFPQLQRWGLFYQYGR